MQLTQLPEKLEAGETVTFRPQGNSMSPRIKSGDLCTVAPLALAEVKVDDIVLARVNGHIYLHLVKAIGSDGRALIGNNKGHLNGWTSSIYGKLVAVE